MNTLFTVLVFLGALGSGVMAGVFFAFSNFVMAALARLPQAEGIRAMQAINVTVLNRPFLSVFMGTGAISIAAIVLGFFLQPARVGDYALPGGAVYLLGCILVTMRANVPLNNALAVLDPQAPDAPARWSNYVRDWTCWNHVRTIACVAALALFILAVLGEMRWFYFMVLGDAPWLGGGQWFMHGDTPGAQ
jgi:uncharacterized membrane protein